MDQQQVTHAARSTGEMVQKVLETGKQVLLAGEHLIEQLKKLQRQTRGVLGSSSKLSGNSYAIWGVAIGGGLLISMMLRGRERR